MDEISTTDGEIATDDPAGPVEAPEEDPVAAGVQDPIDEASWESFPASDPPSFILEPRRRQSATDDEVRNP
jgi:hypothetical protein